MTSLLSKRCKKKKKKKHILVGQTIVFHHPVFIHMLGSEAIPTNEKMLLYCL